MGRWSLFRGCLYYSISGRIMVFVDRWSLFTGGLQLRLDCMLIGILHVSCLMLMKILYVNQLLCQTKIFITFFFSRF